jgi:hypothetical protein
MREIRTSGSEGGGIETNRSSLPLSGTQGLKRLPWTPAFAGVTVTHCKYACHFRSDAKLE